MIPSVPYTFHIMIPSLTHSTSGRAFALSQLPSGTVGIESTKELQSQPKVVRQDTELRIFCLESSRHLEIGRMVI